MSPSHRPTFRSVFLKNYDGGIGSGILSPAPSGGSGGGGGSTTVTPITPMTPMTTPRTPLQILLGRPNGAIGQSYRRSSISRYQQHRGGGGGSASSELREVDGDERYMEKQLLALQLFANFLNTAETTLDDIAERENSGHQVVGPGIVRVCHDLADEIEGVAIELNREHARAARHLERVMSDHELGLIEEGEVNGCEENGGSGGCTEEGDGDNTRDATNNAALALAMLKNRDRIGVVAIAENRQTVSPPILIPLF